MASLIMSVKLRLFDDVLAPCLSQIKHEVAEFIPFSKVHGYRNIGIIPKLTITSMRRVVSIINQSSSYVHKLTGMKPYLWSFFTAISDLRVRQQNQKTKTSAGG